MAAPVDELHRDTDFGRPPLPLCYVIIPALFRRSPPFYPGIRTIKRNTNKIFYEIGMLGQGGFHGTIQLLPLRISQVIEILCLPSPFSIVRMHSVAFNTRIGRALALKTGRRLGPCELSAQFLESLRPRPIQRSDRHPIKIYWHL